MSVLKVAVLDDYQGISEPIFATLDPGSFEVTTFRDTLRPYAHPDTTDAERDALVERLRPFDILCTMRERTPFPEPLILRLPNLKLLLTTSRRNNSFSLPTLASLPTPVPVAGTTDTSPSPDSTTQHTLALILSLARDIPGSHASVQDPHGPWQPSLATPLSGRVFATLGLGRLGVSVARILSSALNMRVIAWSPNLTQADADARALEAGLPATCPRTGDKTFRVVTKEEAFAQADVLSVHLVLSERSRGVVSAPDLALMKPSAFLVNTSRGPLVTEADLLEVLRGGRIAGAALDVFDMEPLPADSEWRTTKWGVEGRSRVVLTPHMGYVEGEKLAGWYEQQVENIKRWVRGEELLNRIV